MTKEYIGREEKCGDCIHVEICERNPILTEFSRENPAYCKKIMKAADVAPVVHGRWEKHGSKWQCTGCKVLMSIDGTPQENLLYYCPNCGAKMDKEEE